MKIQAIDIMVLLDAASALCGIFERDGSYRSMGCKYTRDQILETFNRVNNEIGRVVLEVKEEEQEVNP